jgi:hypothetical protein
MRGSSIKNIEQSGQKTGIKKGTTKPVVPAEILDNYGGVIFPGVRPLASRTFFQRAFGFFL